MYKTSVIQGTILRINQATGSWLNFDEGLRKTTKIWEKNQYPPSFYGPVISETLTKILGSEAKEETRERSDERQKSRKTLFLEYRGGISDRFSKKMRKVTDVPLVFITQTLRNSLPSLKSKVPPMLSSGVVYQVDCSGCGTSYVDKIGRNFTTRLSERLRRTSPLGEHFLSCLSRS